MIVGSPNYNGAARVEAEREALLLLLGAIALVVVPTVLDIAATFWSRADDTDGPLVLAASVFGLWRLRGTFNWHCAAAIRALALPFAVLGLCAFVIGHSLRFYQLEGGGAVCFTWACLSRIADRPVAGRVNFLCAILLFVVPFPASLADALLVPMKLMLAHAVVTTFSAMGFPVASHGVLLSIGFDQLAVADACAGLRSLLSLCAVGLLFVYFVPSRKVAHQVVLLALLPVIALLANFGRVSLLVLITYYFGADWGESAHNLAGYAEVAFTVSLFLLLHHVLNRGIRSAEH